MYKEFYTYLDLKELTDSNFDSMTQDQRLYNIKHNEISFEDYVLSKMNKDDVVILNYDTYDYEIMSKSDYRKEKINKILRN